MQRWQRLQFGSFTMAKLKKYTPKRYKSPILERAKKRGYGPGGPGTPGAKKKRRKKRKS
jgi:hypothetical protein